MAGFKDSIFSILMILFFMFCIIGFTIGFLQDRNPNADILDDKYGLNSSQTTLENSMDGIQGIADNVKNQATNSSAESVNYVFLIFQGGIEIPKAVLGFVLSGLNTLSVLLLSVFLGDSPPKALQIGTMILISGIIIGVVLAFVRMVRTGDER